jgi:hypothetical protein
MVSFDPEAQSGVQTPQALLQTLTNVLFHFFNPMSSDAVKNYSSASAGMVDVLSKREPGRPSPFSSMNSIPALAPTPLLGSKRCQVDGAPSSFDVCDCVAEKAIIGGEIKPGRHFQVLPQLRLAAIRGGPWPVERYLEISLSPMAQRG